MSRQSITEMAALPAGMTYVEEFLSPAEEADLVRCVECLEFGAFEMHGVEAKRRVAHFGKRYAPGTKQLTDAGPIPDCLAGLRARIAERLDVTPDELAEVLVTRYPEGAGIGWHRDAPQFGKVAGVSLLAPCRFKLRPIAGAPGEPTELRVQPRSLYVIAGHARWRWQHSIPAMKTLRYSITFRTLRERA